MTQQEITNRIRYVDLSIKAMDVQLWLHMPKADTTGDYRKIESIQASRERLIARRDALTARLSV